MNFSAFLRILVFTWQAFWRNIWLSLVTVSIIALAFLSINFLIMINVATDAALSIVKEKVDVSVFFRNDASDGEVGEVENFLNALPEVQSVTKKSQAEALEEFRRRHQLDSVIVDSLEELEENPLGSTLIVKANNTTDYPIIIQELEQSDYNRLILDKNFDDNKQFIEQISSVSHNIQVVGLITTGIFIIIGLLIVFNTIRVAVYTQRKEIGIMKLVGATNWFITLPFLLETILYSVISAALGIALIYGTLNFLQPYLNQFFQTSQVNIIQHFNTNFWKIFGLELLVTIALSMLSSLVAIRKYLRV